MTTTPPAEGTDLYAELQRASEDYAAIPEHLRPVVTTPRPGYRPAPVVPDSTGLRERLAEWWRTFDGPAYPTGEQFADAFLASGLAVVGQDVTAEQVTTPADLDALAVGSVVLDRHGDAWQKSDDTEREDEDGERLYTAWASVAWASDRTAREMFDGLGLSTLEYDKCGPFTVLHRADRADAEERGES